MTKNAKRLEKSTHNQSAEHAVAVTQSDSIESQALAQFATTSVLSAATLKEYSGCGDNLEVRDLVVEMKKAGEEVAAGDMTRVEKTLALQLLTLDVMFNNLAQRAQRQNMFKGIDVLLRLALKAQSQARATAETLATMKNPMPYIRQANIAGGHQQINNGASVPPSARTEKSEIVPNKVLESTHGQWLDTGAPRASVSPDQDLAPVGKKHRAKNTGGQGRGGG